jgi:CopG family nickel-responsive transcriptional regulator
VLGINPEIVATTISE